MTILECLLIWLALSAITSPIVGMWLEGLTHG